MQSQVATQPTSSNVPAPINALVRWILRSPFHRLMSHNTMLLTVDGRKSGKQYTIPVSYVREGDLFVTFTSTPWWKNLRGGASVKLLVAGKTLDGVAEAFPGDPETSRWLRVKLERVPRDRGYHHVGLDAEGHLITDDIERAAGRTVLIRITTGKERSS